MKWRISSPRGWGWPRCVSGSDRGWRWWLRKSRRGNSPHHSFGVSDQSGGMLPEILDSWPKTYQAAVALQEELRHRVRLLPLPRQPRLVGGADAISDREDRRLFGAVAVYRFPEMELLEEAGAEAECPFPYRTGLLSFREVPILAAAFRRLKNRPEVL